MNYISNKAQYDNKMQTAYLEFRHICENMLNIEMGWDPEISSNNTLTPEQWEAARLHFTNMYDTMNGERDVLRRIRLEDVNQLIDQMSNMLPRMDYSGRSPKESKWVIELRNATTKAEPICLSPFWREMEAVLNTIDKHVLDMKARWGVVTTFKL
jgi:hypothetical protein